VRRFWKEVSIVAEPGGHAIKLDGKPVRTPFRAPLAVGSATLAAALADEWRGVVDQIDPQLMPLTGLANAAIDIVSADPARFAAGLAAYGESDLLCYRADAPPALVARQADAWDPLLDWARARYDVAFEVVTGIMHRPQPPLTLTRLAGAIAACGPYQLAALAPIVTVTGSLVAALALIEGAATTEQIWEAAQIDEAWQVEKWGDDDIAIATRTSHRAEFDAGVRFLTLV